ncbi:hypothetical protein CLV92_102236 [Kineococcus xinjiangensis]|uniref:Uncharacterized protein n=1 Tax=Kineococcus xinjiangensis TaxID=512762 RepID=A0A2S6IVA6_9ACTN|nr:hypothetical protein [Kineococcus xinjiangensis]PPK98083.1 hypothetical protein CLV92_102236 [Kineococcus xinjiangensis]
MEERRQPAERRRLLDLTRSERGEPERRALPGIERRDLEDREPPLPPELDGAPEDGEAAS